MIEKLNGQKTRPASPRRLYMTETREITHTLAPTKNKKKVNNKLYRFFFVGFVCWFFLFVLNLKSGGGELLTFYYVNNKHIIVKTHRHSHDSHIRVESNVVQFFF
jgi:hypothetical protein